MAGFIQFQSGLISGTNVPRGDIDSCVCVPFTSALDVIRQSKTSVIALSQVVSAGACNPAPPARVWRRTKLALYVGRRKGSESSVVNRPRGSGGVCR